MVRPQLTVSCVVGCIVLFVYTSFHNQPSHSASPAAFDAIIVAAGGQTPQGPPAHVMARLAKAAEMYHDAAVKPLVITTAWGTPHKPCPHDKAGFETHESADNAKVLIAKGVQPDDIREESVSLETVGNALHTRLLHCDVLQLKRLAVINNDWHMPRTRAVFEHVFSIPATAGASPPDFQLQFVEVEANLEERILQTRLEKERRATPKFAAGSEWRKQTSTLQSLHQWLYVQNTAYASSRLLVEKQALDIELLRSY